MLLQVDYVEEVKEAVQAHEEPELEEDIGREGEPRFIGSVDGLIVVVIESLNQGKLCRL